jgi:hypothetical protein
MIMKRRTGLLFCLGVWLAALPCPGASGATGPGASGQDRITVRMEACQVTPRGFIFKSALLVKRGVVEVGGKKYTLYLPKAKGYAVKNTKKQDHVFGNTSTRLAINQHGSGKLTEEDHWFANLPVRLGDKMFDVVEIAPDGSRIVLRPSKCRLRGVVVGRSCPPFSFKTADGKTVSRDRLAGKPFLLDIWSIT